MALKPMTPKTREILQNLSSAAEGWMSHFRHRDDIVSCLAKIGESRVAMAIPELVPYALVKCDEIAVRARGIIGKLALSISPDDLPAFEEQMRTAMSLEWHEEWETLSPSNVPRFSSSADAAGMLGTLSVHRNGFIREAAVKELSKISDGAELGFLLLRLNDWVEPIRSCARTAVLDRLRPQNAESLINVLPLIFRLEGKRRVRHNEIVATSLRVLGSDECRGALVHGISSFSQEIRRACVRIISGMDESAVEPLLKDMLHSRDPSLRFYAARRLLNSTVGDRLIELCTHCGGDKYMPVRLEALTTIVEHFPALAKERLLNSLLDRHGSVRNLARFHLEKDFELDVRSFYRNEVNRLSGTRLAIAIRGLGETGTTEDVEILREYLLDSENLTQRRSALIASARLAPRLVLRELLSALGDRNLSISGAARRVLIPNVTLVTKNDLLPLLGIARPWHVRWNAFLLSLYMSKWDRLIFALQFRVDEDAKIASAAQTGVVAWLNLYNRSAVAPNSRELNEVEEALLRASSVIDELKFEELRNILLDWQNRR